MPQEKINHLITDLHERFGDDLVSDQQKALMDNLNRHMSVEGDVDLADPNFKETLDLLLEDVEADHPQAAAVVREVMSVLNSMGV